LLCSILHLLVVLLEKGFVDLYGRRSKGETGHKFLNGND